MALPKIYTHSRGKAGITLVEILIVIALFAFVGGSALIISMDSYRGFSFRNERDVIISALQKARSQAINNMCFGASCTDGKAHGLHVASPNLTLFQGGSYSVADPLNEVISANNNSAVLSGLTDVVFAQLSGDVASPGTITVTDTSLHTSSITINSEGRITWTN